MSTTRLFPTSQGKLAYRIYGKGPKYMLAFHGFGQDGTVFSGLSRSISNEYTTISFDLYFHGQSQWINKDLPLRKGQWVKSIQSFLDQNNIESFDLLAFSLGGKFALTLTEVFADRIAKAILIAPDGIGTSFWYNLATYPLVFRRYFKSLIKRPNRFLKIVKSMHKTGLMDKGLLKFATTQMKTVEQRHRVYYSWVIFKPIKPNLNKLRKVLESKIIHVDLYLGKYDKVITHKSLQSFVHNLSDVEVMSLPCGHNQLIGNVRDILAQNP